MNDHTVVTHPAATSTAADADSAFPRDSSDEAAILCESCGYRLDGLPDRGNCPECGAPIAESTVASPRTMPAWETAGGIRGFVCTSVRVLFGPTAFFRTLRTRVDDAAARRSRRFAYLHMLMASVVAAVVVLQHGMAVSTSWAAAFVVSDFGLLNALLAWVGLTVLSFAGFLGVKALAARLTAWEAGYRGLRLPASVVRRGMDYHTASLLPVVLALLFVVLGFRLTLALGLTDGYGAAGYLNALMIYLGVLGTACVAGAIYLFWTYWIGMKNMLHANV